METNYDALRLVEMRALAKERGLQGYYRLERAELIALLRVAPWDKPTPTPLVSVNPRPKRIARPPKPM